MATAPCNQANNACGADGSVRQASTSTTWPFLRKVRDEVGAIGGDADVPLAGLPLAFREVSRQPFLGVAAFTVEVGLQLEHGAAEQGVDASMDFGD